MIAAIPLTCEFISQLPLQVLNAGVSRHLCPWQIPSGSFTAKVNCCEWFEISFKSMMLSLYRHIAGCRSYSIHTVKQQYLVFPLVFTLCFLFSCNVTVIISHYRWIGNTDGDAYGLRSKAVLLLAVEWFIPSMYLYTVCVCVCCLQTDQSLSEEWKAQDVISSHIDFPVQMLNWSCWGIHNWS